MVTDRELVLNKFDSCCAYCGCPVTIENFQVDHVKARHLGGLDELDNYYPACRSCNATKATYTIEAFRQRLIDDVNRMRRDSSKFRILERFKLVREMPNDLVFWFEKYN